MAYRMECWYIRRDELLKISAGHRSYLMNLGRAGTFIEPITPMGLDRFRGFLALMDTLGEWRFQTMGSMGWYTPFGELQSGNPGAYTFDKATFYEIQGFMGGPEGKTIVELMKWTVPKLVDPCPCGSGKEYEVCCYKIVGPDGKRKFYGGAARQDSFGKWHPMPGPGLAVTVIGTVVDEATQLSERLAASSQLPPNRHARWMKCFVPFERAYRDLKEYLHTPQGHGASFQMHSPRLTTLLRSFLFSGRMLIDYVGLQAPTTLHLKEKVRGINAERYESLVAELMANESHEPIAKKLSGLKSGILRFIEVRNTEKVHQNALKEPPTISPSGISSGGLIWNSFGKEDIGFHPFVEGSYDVILRFLKVILCINLQ